MENIHSLVLEETNLLETENLICNSKVFAGQQQPFIFIVM